MTVDEYDGDAAARQVQAMNEQAREILRPVSVEVGVLYNDGIEALLQFDRVEGSAIDSTIILLPSVSARQVLRELSKLLDEADQDLLAQRDTLGDDDKGAPHGDQEGPVRSPTEGTDRHDEGSGDAI